MKILYDYQILFNQRYGGISRYFYELILRLNDRSNCLTSINCFFNQNYYFGKYFKHEKTCKALKKYQRKIIGKLNQHFTIIQLKKDFDIFHPTYYNPYFIGKTKSKVVLTVYDMIQEIFPSLYQDFVRTDKYKTIHAADHLIAISESTKRDIISIYGDIPADKITVIYIGSNMKKCGNHDLKSKFPEKYILFVGQREGYKNFETFVKAVCPALSKDNSLKVVCTGGGSFQQNEISLMGDFFDRFIQINCDDSMLSAAYTYAELFVFPSKYEGFGLPTLEAFACDCPVILSNTSSMPEVGGDAVLYFDPENVDELSDRILRILQSPSLREELVNKGREQMKKFDWDDIAEQTYQCYREVLAQQ